MYIICDKIIIKELNMRIRILSIVAICVVVSILVTAPMAEAVGFCYQWNILSQETTSSGTMTVSKAQCVGGEKVSAVFSSFSGETIVLNASLGFSEIHLPSGVVSTQLLAGNAMLFMVSTNSGGSYEFTTDSDGTPLTLADETAMTLASSALTPGSENVVQDAYNYNLETGYDPLAFEDRGVLPPWFGCAAASAGLIGSYAAFVPLVGGGGVIGWIGAIALHEIAVVSWVDSCFVD